MVNWKILRAIKGTCSYNRWIYKICAKDSWLNRYEKKVSKIEIKKHGKNSTDVKWKRGNLWILLNEIKLN